MNNEAKTELILYPITITEGKHLISIWHGTKYVKHNKSFFSLDNKNGSYSWFGPESLVVGWLNHFFASFLPFWSFSNRSLKMLTNQQ